MAVPTQEHRTLVMGFQILLLSGPPMLCQLSVFSLDQMASFLRHRLRHYPLRRLHRSCMCQRQDQEVGEVSPFPQPVASIWWPLDVTGRF